MGLDLVALSIDAHDPARLARFWSGLLGWANDDDSDGDAVAGLLPTDDTGFRLRLTLSQAEKSEQNRMHVDLTSTSLADQQATVAGALALGARHRDVDQRAEQPHVVLADPEGNEFCVIEPCNSFLADCGFVGALACDGSQRLGYFWSSALGWPLVWDQDQETAIRSPHGGPKLTWGGPTVRPQVAKNRLHLDVASSVLGGQQAEVGRLLALGATRLDPGHAESGRNGGGVVLLADPDGNEFSVLPSTGHC